MYWDLLALLALLGWGVTFAYHFLQKHQSQLRERNEHSVALRQQFKKEMFNEAMMDCYSTSSLIGFLEYDGLRSYISDVLYEYGEMSFRLEVFEGSETLFDLTCPEGIKDELSWTLELDNVRLSLTDEPVSSNLTFLTAIAVHVADRVLGLQREIRDSFTGLYNKKHCLESLEYEVERARRYGHVASVIFLDIDHFKRLNDTYGHPTGDKVLLGVTEALNKHHRQSDVICRYGGEEFVLLLPETGKDEALELAEILRQEVEGTAFESLESNLPIHLTISLGVSSYPPDGVSAEELLEQADKALYRSKQHGRNRVSAA